MATHHSMQVCMETTDWLKGIVSEDVAGTIDTNSSSSSPSAELISCVRPSAQPMAIERRLRPPHDHPLKCPRCDSAHTKFCYYNNYSLSQPRYFCKTCRRYWTKGGSLRNVPVGGGCRKNKRSTAKKPSQEQQHATVQYHNHHQPTELQLSNLNFMFEGSSHLFTGSCDIGLGDHFGHGFATHELNPLGLGFSIDGGHGAFAESCQRLTLPFEGQQEEDVRINEIDVKPGNRMLSLEWPEQGCGDSYGYANGIGHWAGMINGHGPSSAAM